MVRFQSIREAPRQEWRDETVRKILGSKKGSEKKQKVLLTHLVVVYQVRVASDVVLYIFGVASGKSLVTIAECRPDLE
jgi:hypothetical protein